MTARHTQPTCPGCREPLDTIVWHGLIPARQIAYVEPDADPATYAAGWDSTETFDETEMTAYYTSECCDRLLSAATVAQFPVPKPNRTARALIPPTDYQRGKEGRA